MSNAPSICVEHRASHRCIASTHEQCHVRTDERTNERQLKLSNALVDRFARAQAQIRRFAVPIVEIHRPEIGLSTGFAA